MSPKRVVLVTGAAGFLGANLVRYLLAHEDCEIVALDDLSGGFRDNLPEDVNFVQGSITDHKLLENLFNDYPFTHVYHLAAYAAEGLSHFIRRFNYTNNLIGSVNLINECVKHEIECFVFTSSIAVYGSNQVPMYEDMVPQPEDPYGVAKYAVELDLKIAHEMFGLPYVVFRPHNLYGKYQNIGDKYRNVVGIFMNQILQGLPMTIFGDGEQQRAFSFVGDILRPMAQAPLLRAAHNRVFNIGASQPYTVNILAQKVAEAMGHPGHPITHLEARNEVKFAYSDHTAVHQTFGNLPETSLDEGLRVMVEWVKSVGARTSQRFDAIEITKNLPPSWSAS